MLNGPGSVDRYIIRVNSILEVLASEILNLLISLCLQIIISTTKKYPLRGYILGVLTHTTAQDQRWRGDETLK